MRRALRGSIRKLAGGVLVASGLGLCAAVIFHPAQEKESDDLQKRRADWFYRQRAFPHRYVPAGARQLALRELDAKLEREQARRAARIAAPAAASWTYIGPQPIQTPYTDPIVSGRGTAVAVAPHDATVVVAGGAHGGGW